MTVNMATVPVKTLRIMLLVATAWTGFSNAASSCSSYGDGHHTTLSGGKFVFVGRGVFQLVGGSGYQVQTYQCKGGGQDIHGT